MQGTAAGLALVGMLLGAMTASAAPAAVTAASDAGKYKNHRYLYAVYCNGTVDKLDLVQRTKLSSLQLSERSATPAAVAALPGPGADIDGCLARPVVMGRTKDSTSGVVHIVASDRLEPDASYLKPYSLLSFALPDWTLREKRALGRYNMRDGSPPRMVRGAGGKLTPASKDFKPLRKASIPSSPDAEDWEDIDLMERSGDGRFLVYAGIYQNGIGLADIAQRTAVDLDVPADTSGMDLRLAPGGRFVLFSMRHIVQEGELTWSATTGVLRLYDTSGQQVAQVTDPQVAGDWHCIAVTPQGLAVFTDRRGDYRFVSLGRTFGIEPVVDMELDDQGGARPGVVYFGQ